MKPNSKLSLLSLALVVMSLAACGGSSTRHDEVKQPDIVVDKPVTMMDSFTKFVMNLVATAPDDNEPIVIADVSVTMPEDTEPATVN